MSLNRLIRGAILASALTISLPGLASAQTGRPSGSTNAVTYAQVLQLLELKIDDEAILKRLGGTTFVLDAQQEAALKAAGASERLLAAMRRAPAPAANAEVANWVIILDCSKSMMERTREGTTKMEAAKKAVIELLRDMPNGLNVAFVIYGHDAALECAAVKVVRPLGKLDNDAKADMALVIAELQPTGHTPIALSLEVARKELAKSGGPGGVILITDGIETCHGNPVDEAGKVNAKLGVNVVGFGLTADEQTAVGKIAEAGKGKFFAPSSAADLAKEMVAVREVVKVSTPAAPKVDEMGATSVGKPAALKAGTPAHVIIGKDGAAYAAISLPAGDHKVVMDMRRGHSTNMICGVSVLDEDGAEVVKKLISLNAIDNGYRGVGRVSLKAPKKVIVKVSNFSEEADFWVTVAPAGAEASLVPFYGTVVPQPLKLDQEATGLLQKEESAYYAVTVPKGQYKLVVGYENANGNSTNLQGYAAGLGSDGGGQEKVVTFNEIDSSSRKSAGLNIAEDMTLIVRLKNNNYAMKTALRVRPAGE